MIYSDNDIRRALINETLGIDPFNLSALQPASYDTHLYHQGWLLADNKPVDLKDPDATNWEEIIIPDTGFVIEPDMFVLLSTIEAIRLGPKTGCLIDGSSTLSRCGFAVHQTGQWVDPGFHGTLTYECKCVNGVGVRVYPEIEFGQLIFMSAHTEAMYPYRGRYQGQKGPQRPRTKR